VRERLKGERLLLGLLAAAALLLRAVAFFRYRFDSDEQQHLHVVWGWTAGLVQYRDVFDNHAPLFHMSMAPLLAMLGERADILLWMRIPMLALFAVVLWATYDLARRLWDGRVAVWAVVLLALFPPFFLKSLEFRIDNLWNALWMLALVGLVRGWRPFAIGLLLGCALAVSMKTTLLVATVVGAGAIVWSLRPDARRLKPTRAVLEALAGFALVPMALATYFLAVGAFDELVYCNFIFNGRLATMRKELWIGRIAFPFLCAALVWVAWRFRAITDDAWKYFLAVLVAVYGVTVSCLWVAVSPRDFLTMMPVGAMFAAALLQFRGRAIAALLSVAALWYYTDRFENNTDWHITMMNQVLRLSRPGEMLLDHKGETIYRRRPFYPALEYVTRMQLARGIIADTIPEDVVRTRTYVAQADGPMLPPRTRAFLSANFLDMGRLRTAGQWLQDDGSFSIAIPGEYVIVSERGEVLSARVYPAGPHRVPPTGEKLAVMWAPAFRRGHSPFHLRDREF
jgi:Dolichyl-phosphate-mannose-protein mannosyltransferase